MMNLSILTFNLLNSFIFLQANHPLAMTLIIIIQTCIISLTTGMMSSSFWFSYILFLVFLGGMLGLFIYITSLASNELFYASIKSLMIIILLVTFVLAVATITDPYFWNMLTKNTDLMSIDLLPSTPYTEATPHLIKLYNSPNHLITLMLVNYLFLTLIVIVKITNIFQGPLRQKF
uniref:NADH-ubiquinone oxidoreductase chain 6 n=1 Tax=Gampsocleis gratiosa TaxID=420844 RepID=B5L7S4_GAMGR|nr:NADH dehydrogenase subunit 6 [Gampsocleis gratiosa]ACA61243.1 NADH dehydrogenase subunit 6 [Gampsocleis gratiosa]